MFEWWVQKLEIEDLKQKFNGKQRFKQLWIFIGKLKHLQNSIDLLCNEVHKDDMREFFEILSTRHENIRRNNALLEPNKKQRTK